MSHTHHSKSIPQRAPRRICAPWIVLLLLLALPAAVEAQFTCTTNNGTITITGYTGPGGAVTIPNVINGYPVTAIGFGAFFNCTSLTSVSIGTSVTSIGGRTFENCTNLTSITIPDSVASIGELTFAGCDSLTNVWIGVNLTSIGSAAFDYCRSLTAITVDAFNSSYSSVDGVLFNKSVTTLVLCPRAKAGSYVIPNSVIGIGDYSFSDCPCLTSITIPNSVVSIGLYAFGSCTMLSSVSMGNGVKSIGDGAFNYCSMLTNVTIGSGVTSLGAGAFQYCTGLTSVTIPGSVSSIGGYAFSDCPLLAVACFLGNAPSADSTVFQNGHATVYYLPGTTGWGPTFGGRLTALWPPPTIPFIYTTNGDFTITIMGYTGSGGDVAIPGTINGLPVTGIGSNTFWYCTSLTSVTIPSSVTSIGDAAFGWCTSLTNVTIANGLTTIRDKTFYICTNLTSITIPNSVTNIGEEAFYACTSLASVTIPSSVTSIGDGAFVYCLSLTSVIIPNSVSSIGGYAFSGCFLLTGVYFLGNAPSADSTVFQNDHATVYYLPGTTGWGSTFGGLPTALWQSPPPGAWTLSATTITTTGATLNGTVNPNGWPTTAWFQWGTTTDYGNLTPATGMGSGTSALPLSAPLAGLTPGVTYHYRVAATNSNGAGYSSDCSFTTLGPPEVWTLSATAVTATNAMLNGTVNPNGYPTTAWFQWGTTTSYGNLTAATDMGSGTSDLPLSVALAGLTLGATYHYRVAGTNDYGTVYGSDQSFTTATLPPPEVYTLSAIAVTATTATLNGTVNPNGLPTTAWFEWGTTANYGNLTSVTALGSGTTALPLSAPLAGLTPGVTYHFRIAATNDYGLAYGSDQSFTTQALSGGAGWTLNGGATMTGNTITLTVGAGNTSRSAFLNNKQDITAFHIVFFYQDVSGAGSADGVTFCIQNDPRGPTALGGGSGGSSLGYENITPSVALALNIYAPNGRGVALFQNGAVTYGYASLLPDVDIGGNTNIIQVNVDYNGTVMTMTFKEHRHWGHRQHQLDREHPVRCRGQHRVRWVHRRGRRRRLHPDHLVGQFDAHHTDFDVARRRRFHQQRHAQRHRQPGRLPHHRLVPVGHHHQYGNLTAATGMGSGTNALSLSAPLAGLTPGVTYHFRVAATNENGLVYGSDLSFTTLGPPQVSTLPATAVSTDSATLNGTVNPNGYTTSAWFQWGTTTNYGNLTPVTDLGSATTALPLSAPLAGLTPGVTYHFRIAATNDYGLAYGSDQSFTTESLPTEFNYTINNGTVTITGYTGPGGAATIPDTINGLPVTSIGNSALSGCWTLTSVTIPNSVTSIGDSAFAYCTGLRSITIPNSVTTIGSSAFYDCNGLSSVAIPNSVSTIGDSAFAECTSLTSVSIPNSITSIADCTFVEC